MARSAGRCRALLAVLPVAVAAAACGTQSPPSSLASSSSSSIPPAGTSGPAWVVDAGVPLAQPTSAACPDSAECVVGMRGLAVSPFLLVRSDGSWSVASVETPSGEPRFFPSQIACPTASRCVSAGSAGPREGPGVWPAVATTTDGGRTWTAQVFLGYSGSAFNTVACPTAQECFAAGSVSGPGNVGQVLATTDGGRHWAAETVGGPIREVDNIACWDASHCVGTGDVTSGGALVSAALMATSDGGRHWSSRAAAAFSTSGGLTCPARMRCVLVGSTGQTVSDFRPVALSTTDGETWQEADLSRLPVVRPATVSCGSAAFCVAVGQGEGSIGTPERGLQAGVILESTSTGATWTSRPLPAGIGVLQVVACAASGFCIAGGASLATPTWRLLLRRPD